MSNLTQKSINDISVLVPTASSISKKIGKSFFRKNGHHLNKYQAAKLFAEDMSLITKIIYPKKTVAVFGSARVSNTFYKNLADKAYELGYKLGKKGYAISTGGGPGIMQWSCAGVVDAKSIAFGFQPKFIEEKEKPVIMENKFQYQVSSLHSRKILMANNAEALIFFPGGAGTIDEFFHYLNFYTKSQLGNIKFILFDDAFWNGLIKWIDSSFVKTGFIKREILKNIFLVDNTKEALRIILNSSNSSYKPDPLKLSNRFKEDILQLFNYIEKLPHPSASFFGSLQANYKFSFIKKLITKITSILQKNNYVIYYSSLNGFSNLMSELNKKGAASKNITLGDFKIPLELSETQKLILGATDILFFYPGDLNAIDALTDYIVRIQMGDMERVPINLIDPSFWGSYLKWFERFPVNYGFAEKELIDYCKLVSKAEQIVLSI